MPSDEALRPSSARNFIPPAYCRGTRSQTRRNERSGRIEQGTGAHAIVLSEFFRDGAFMIVNQWTVIGG